MLFLLVLKTSKRKHFPVLSQKRTQYLDANFSEMLKEATIHFCLFDESHFSNTFTL